MTDRKRLLEEESDSAYSASDDETADLRSPRAGPITGYGYGSGRHKEAKRRIEFSKLPWGIWLLEKLGLCGFKT